MKVLLTGGSGKLGRYMLPLLRQSGHIVTNFDRQSFDEETDTTIVGDIEDLPAVVQAAENAEVILHLAGIPTYGVAPDNVTFRVNAMGAFNIHEAARISGVRRVVSLSSEAVLGWSPGTWVNPHFPDYLPIDENHVCQPQDPYGLSKQVLECVGRTFTARYGLETLFIRATWIASPEEMEQLARSGGRRPVDFGLFHYIDVRDLAQACLRAVDCPLTGSQAIYVGAGETSISEPLSSLYQKLAPSVAESASMLTGHSAPVSIELAKKLLGWSPERSWRKFKL